MAINMASLPQPMYRLVNPQLMRTLMQRTGDGSRVGHRALAAAAGCATGTIGHLLDGTQETVPVDVAHGLARRLGVGVLVLFAPPHCADVSEALMALAGVGA